MTGECPINALLEFERMKAEKQKKIALLIQNLTIEECEKVLNYINELRKNVK